MGRTRNLEKNRRKTKSSLIPITIIITLSLIFSSLTINNILLIGNEKNNYKNLVIRLSKKEEEYKIENDNKNELISELTELNNIDETINNKKTSVFELASKLENQIINKETNHKIAYLTFDDGPYYSTNKVLNILKQYQVKATFFTIGLDKDICYDNKNYSCKDTYKKIVDNGHTIANHTYSHAIFRGLYSSPQTFMNQVKQQERLIEERTGIKTNILRFPGGSATARALAKNNVNTIFQELKNNKYGWVDWTSQDGDGGYLPSYDIAWNNFTKTIDENIEVVLFHDYSNITISMLPKAIEYLEEKDYILLPLFYDSIKINK